jgi:carbonic anhydrase
MSELPELFANNRAWAVEMLRKDPEFFRHLAHQQTPRYLWIGCSDSRVPANEIIGLEPGQVFVQRNVANLVNHSDLNCLSVLQYAIDVLKVEHVIVCGHYGCGGVSAAWRGAPLGLIDNWLRHLQDVASRHRDQLQGLPEPALLDRLCELNVVEQASNVCRTTMVQEAWRRGQEVTVHGWVYGLKDGRLRDLAFSVSGFDRLEEAYQRAVADKKNGR